MVASVLIWAAPTQAQNTAPPIAIGSVSITSEPGTTPATATLVGSNSFDPGSQGDNNGIASFQWEVVTSEYSWLSLATPKEATTTFMVPSASLAARYGTSIEFRLTVTDGDTPSASASTTVTFNINQGPVADIAVSAMLPASDPKDVAGYDDNGNGTKDENAERFNVQGVIDGPGENGNADNEWDIAEGALLTLDGTGSSDPEGRPITTYTWERIYSTTGSGGMFDNLPAEVDPDGASSNALTGSRTSTDEDPRAVPGDGDPIETLGQLEQDSGRPHAPYYVYYSLVVGDSAGTKSNPAVVKIVIHDQPQAPVVKVDGRTGVKANKAAAPTGNPASAVSGETVPPGSSRYVVAPGSVVTVTATATDADGGDLQISWDGAQAPAADDPGSNGDDRLTATFRAPADAEDGQEFTVTVTAADVTGMTGSKSVTLVVAANNAPDAVAPGTLVTTHLYSVITVEDGPDGGDINPATQKGTGVVKLRGIGFDSDGGSLTHVWSELSMARNDDGTMIALPTFTREEADCPGGFTADTDQDGTDESCPVNMPSPIRLPAKARITIDNAFSETASFAVPEVNARDAANSSGITYDLNGDGDTDDPGETAVSALHIPIAYTVIDSRNVSTTQIVIVRIVNNDDRPVADAGADQQVSSGSFVRLNGSASSDSDPGDKIKHQWTYDGISTDPLTEGRAPVTAAEEAQGFAEGKWFPYDGKVKVYAADGDDADIEEMKVFSNHRLDKTQVVDGVYPFGSVVGGPAGPGPDGEMGTGDDIIQVEPGVLEPADANDPDTPQDETKGDAPRGSYHPTAGGLLSNAGSAYPYFDAPMLFGFNSVKLTFSLVVTDGQATAATGDDAMSAKADKVTVTVADGYYSGNVSGPDFCTEMSLGGSQTYAFDSDGDGVADTCSLDTTRRGAVARQNALETLAELNPDTFKDALHGPAGDAMAGTCYSARTDLGDDTAAALAADSCGPANAAKRAVSSRPAPVDPAVADVFFSGVVTGPDYCANRALGGAPLYGLDADGDGVGDTCSLGYTRREAVARQKALMEAFPTSHDQYAAALAAACTALGSTDFDDDPADLAKDICNPQPASAKGDPLPTSTN